MNVATDFVPRVKVEEPGKGDKTFSHTGQADFTKAEPEIKTFPARPQYTRPRTRASQNNSYT